MALSATCRTYYAKRPGYVKQERKAIFAKVSDWAFMRAHCKHTGKRHTKACTGIGHNFSLHPACAK